MASFGPVDGAHDAEVVVEGDHHAGQRGEGQAIIAGMRGALLDDGLEQQELAEEPGQRRDAGQRGHGQRHRRRQQGRAPVQAGQGAEVFAIHLPQHEANHGEGGEHGEQVAAEVVEHGGPAGRAQGGDAQQQVAGVRDARIAEQPLEVALRNGAEVAVENGDAGNDDQQVGPLGRDVRHGDEQHAQQQDEAGGLRADGQKGGHRRGRALIDIRRPDLEGKGGDLESEPHQHQHEAEEEDLVAAELRRHPGQLRRS